MRHPRISCEPKVMTGKPVIRGTRVPVETILRHLGAGDDLATILADFPDLTADDVCAAQAYAAGSTVTKHVDGVTINGG